MRIVAYDPYVSDERVRTIGAASGSLQDVLEQAEASFSGLASAGLSDMSGSSDSSAGAPASAGPPPGTPGTGGGSGLAPACGRKGSREAWSPDLPVPAAVGVHHPV